jgi:hypothetical protein
MYPHERSLVSKMSGKPFALIGVNSDNNREALKKTLVDEKITWRSFWNGGSTSGPISRAWGVRGWPTLVLIDAKGVIRERWEGAPPGDVLDKAVEALVKEAGG